MTLGFNDWVQTVLLMDSFVIIIFLWLLPSRIPGLGPLLHSSYNFMFSVGTKPTTQTAVKAVQCHPR